LARQTRLKIVAVEPDPAKAGAARRLLDRAGLYGTRVSVHEASLTALPYGAYFANLIVSDSLLVGGQLPANPAEVHRCLRPGGGTLVLGLPAGPAPRPRERAALQAWLNQGGFGAATLETQGGLWAFARRGPLAGAGDWTHQYGGADNSACSKDQLVKGELSVLWWGEPGPRPMPDRGARNPAAVSANGRLYVQGDRILFGLDAYNGAILWNLAAPELRRANVPRDSSNMAAAPDALYIAAGQYACVIDGQTGARRQTFKVPESSATQPHDWGYLGVIDNILLGSATRRGASYLGDDGEWYDSASPADVAIVTSDYLFGQDRHTGEHPWTYHGGIILNPTITVGDGIVYFIESRNPAARSAKSGRMNREVFRDQALVALDLRTGRKLWEQATDFSAAQRMLYLAYGSRTLVVVGSSEKDYHLWAYDAPAPSPQPETTPTDVMLSGVKLWEQHHPFAREDHGGAIQHPLIVGHVLYSERRAFDLRGGKQLRDDLPERRGCGAMAAAQHSFFYRHHFHGMWDLETDQRTQFLGIRGGCWIGMIPSGGLVLAPETSSGCSCTHSVQTSVAYIPKTAK
jgi:outer membrane protein assembly factor BamB